MMQTLIATILRSDTGATAIEYGLIGGLIAVVITTAVTLLGSEAQALYERIAAGVAGV